MQYAYVTWYSEMLLKDRVNRMVSVGNEQVTSHESVAKNKSTPPGSDIEEITTVQTYMQYE